MGMFDKDKVFAPDGILNGQGGFADFGEEFILFDCEIKTEEFKFDPNEAGIPMAHLTVAKKMTPEQTKIVSSLSGPICDKVREKADDDLPAVVRLESVPASKKEYNDAVVIRFLEAYDAKSKA
jgi:hypothetical protein